MAWSVTAAVPHTLDLASLEQKLATALARSEKPGADVALRFISHEESQTLNRQYRKKDKPGNVLSFPAAAVPEDESLLGDVFIAYPIMRQGFADDLTDEAIALSLAVHGFLHLLGYDHEEDADEEEMERVHASLVS